MDQCAVWRLQRAMIPRRPEVVPPRQLPLPIVTFSLLRTKAMGAHGDDRSQTIVIRDDS